MDPPESGSRRRQGRPARTQPRGSDVLLDPLALVADHDGDDPWVGLGDRIEHVAEHRLSQHGVQHFGGGRPHSGARAGGEHDDESGS